MADNRQLENEIEFLTKLIETHKGSHNSFTQQISSTNRLPEHEDQPQQKNTSSSSSSSIPVVKKHESLQKTRDAADKSNQTKKNLKEKADELEKVLADVRKQFRHSLINSKSASNISHAPSLKCTHNLSATTRSNCLSKVKSSPVSSSSSKLQHQKLFPQHSTVGVANTSSLLKSHSSSSPSSPSSSSIAPRLLSNVRHVTFNVPRDCSSDSSQSPHQSPYKVRRLVKSATVPSKLDQHPRESEATTMSDFTSAKRLLIATSKSQFSQGPTLQTSAQSKPSTSSTAAVFNYQRATLSSVQREKSQPTVYLKSKHKLIKKAQATIIAESNLVVTNTKPSFHQPHHSHGNHSPYKLIKNVLSEPKPRTTTHTKLNEKVKELCSRYKVIRENADHRTVRRQRRLSATKSSPPPSNVHTQSRYKLVKKAIETAHRKGRERSLSGGQLKRGCVKKYPKPKKTRFSIVKDKSEAAETAAMDVNMLLGRTVHNVSRNMYKFVKSASLRRPHTSHKLRNTRTNRWHASTAKQGKSPSVSPYSIMRENLTKAAVKPRTSGIVKIQGAPYSILNHGKTLLRSEASPIGGTASRKFIKHRVRLGGVAYLQTQPGKLVREAASTTITRARQSVQRSIWTAATSQQRKLRRTATPTSKYCLFYNRFGKCNRADHCLYVHDPARIAICTRFLRGTCSVAACPFSHDAAPSKLPTCRYFLRGRCVAANNTAGGSSCPYLHVNVGAGAAVCEDFLDGLCPRGDECKKSHNAVCPEFESRRSCTKGNKCRLLHSKRGRVRGASTTKRKRSEEVAAAAAATTTKQQQQNMENDMFPLKKTRLTEAEDDDSHLPMSVRNLPAFIALDMHPKSTEEDRIKRECIREEPRKRQIKPRFFLD